MGSILGERYVIIKETGRGTYGKIFEGRELEGQRLNVAVKVSSRRRPVCVVVPPATGNVASKMCSNLESEYWALKQLEKFPGFPDVYELDTHGEESYLVMELLERPLWSLFTGKNFKMSMQDICLIMDQMLPRLEALHGAGMVHGDIKPENLMMGTGTVKNTKGTIYLIDFGLVTNYGANGVSNQKHYSSGGTLRYMSTRVHDGLPKTPRDDLESFAYTMAVFMDFRNVPWRSEKDMNLVGQMKKKITGNELFSGQPKEFAAFYDAIKNLKDGEEFKYGEYQKLFRKFGKRACCIQYGHDWLFWETT